MLTYTIREATTQEAEQLTQLAHHSKKYWGYPQEWITLWRDQLTVTPRMIRDWVTLVAEYEGEIKGFWCREPKTSDTPSEGLLFISPDAIGTGCGRQLWTAMRKALLARGVDHFVIEADPNAVGFYQKLGATQIGENRSKEIEGRVLPVLRFQVK